MSQFSEVSGGRGVPVFSLREPASSCAANSGWLLQEHLADLPAGKAFAAGDVKHARALQLEQFPGGARRHLRCDGAAEFIVEQPQSFARPPRQQQLLVDGVVPGGADARIQRGANYRVCRVAQDDLLGGRLGFRIDNEGIYRRGFVVIALSPSNTRSVEKKMKGMLGGQFRQHASDFHVYLARKIGIRLAFGSPAERRAVNDAGGLLRLESTLNRGEVRQFQHRRESARAAWNSGAYRGAVCTR